MPTPDFDAVLNTLREAADFALRVGAHKEAIVLEDFWKRFQKEQPTLPVLRGIVLNAMDKASAQISKIVEDERRDPKPGMEALARDHTRIWVRFLKLLHPPEWSEMDIRAFAGSKFVKEKSVSYKGNPDGVRPIVEGSIAAIRHYSELIASGDFDQAFELTDAGLQDRMDLRKFVNEHERAAQKYHGPALEFQLQRFAYVYADDVVRQESNTANEGWPNLTAKANRRGRMLGFWIRDRAANTGCGGSLWIAEESGTYRIAKFDFFRP